MRSGAVGCTAVMEGPSSPSSVSTLALSFALTLPCSLPCALARAPSAALTHDERRSAQPERSGGCLDEDSRESSGCGTGGGDRMSRWNELRVCEHGHCAGMVGAWDSGEQGAQRSGRSGDCTSRGRWSRPLTRAWMGPTSCPALDTGAASLKGPRHVAERTTDHCRRCREDLACHGINKMRMPQGVFDHYMVCSCHCNACCCSRTVQCAPLLRTAPPPFHRLT